MNIIKKIQCFINKHPAEAELSLTGLTQILFFSVFSIFLCVLCFAEEFIYDSHGKKDPFSPPIISSVEKPGTEVLAGVRLEGIIWDENKPLAVINDKVVGIGDSVSGAKIMDIKQNEVLFDVNGQRINVKLRAKVE